MKNSNRITAIRPSVQSYRHFTAILAYGMVGTGIFSTQIIITKNLSVGLLVWMRV